jgi:glycogen operon protein
VNPFFDWGKDQASRIEYCDSVIYETHVKGMTKLHPDIPPEIRGTYTAMGHPAIIAHLQKLGITAVELMPIHQFVQDTSLVSKGLTNYWGYNTIGFFAPHNGFAAYGTRGEQVQEFKSMVQALHKAGIEVILDVVYNHTAEGNHMGPTLSFRGIDNAAYYRLVDGDRAHYFDTTGTGNSLLMRSPAVLQLIMDSLRYWVTDMHVDGFRFDLAATLARQFHEVDKLSAFFDIVHQDPVVSQVKLIAEPWDLGSGGYQVGGFPPLWAEWNGKYRDTVRDFWRSQPSTLPEFASRITGSSDLYEHSGRKPAASINFVIAHDGFTLNDLVSYNDKHNLANGEGGNDGESHNRSWNCGVEGPTTDPEILKLRARQRRNFLATLLLSQGVPMLAHGDEIARTQDGNNNVYCQDNTLSWMPWTITGEQEDLLEFTQKVIALRLAHPVLHRRTFFGDATSKDALGEGTLPEADWFDISGDAMNADDWNNGIAKTTTLFLNGDAIPEMDRRGNPVVDSSFLLMFNAHYGPLEFTIPSQRYGAQWTMVLDTNAPVKDGTKFLAGEKVKLEQRSMVVLTRPPLHSAPTAPRRSTQVSAGPIPRLVAILRSEKKPIVATKEPRRKAKPRER